MPDMLARCEMRMSGGKRIPDGIIEHYVILEMCDGIVHSAADWMWVVGPELQRTNYSSTVLISRLRHRYQHAIERYGAHGFAIFSITAGFGHLRFL